MDSIDEVADDVLRKCRHYVRPTARVLLLSTFLEDGLRMFYQWNDQVSYIKSTWRCGAFLSFLFVLFNLVGQLVPSGLILLRKSDQQIRIGVYVLVCVIGIQSMAYSILWNLQFFMRNLAVCGSLLLLYSETTMERKNMFGTLPDMGEAKLADWLQAAGRILVIFMFITMIKFDSTGRMIVEAIGTVLIACVGVGFKTKASAMCLVILMFLQNIVLNDFWNESSRSAFYDFKKYDFFQTLSIIGALLLLVAFGPGGIAMDERKKTF